MEFQNNSTRLCKLSGQSFGMAPTENKSISKFCGLWSFLLMVQECLCQIFSSPGMDLFPPEVMFSFNVNNLYGVMHLSEDTLKILHSIPFKTYEIIWTSGIITFPSCIFLYIFTALCFAFSVLVVGANLTPCLIESQFGCSSIGQGFWNEILICSLINNRGH